MYEMYRSIQLEFVSRNFLLYLFVNFFYLLSLKLYLRIILFVFYI